MFHHVSKVILCDRRNTFASFSEDDVHVSWQAQHFGRAHLHFAWQAQHFIDVWCCLFFVNRIVMHHAVAKCKLRGKRCILRRVTVMKIDGILARKIDFEVADFGIR